MTGLALLSTLLGTERYALYLDAVCHKEKLHVRIYGEAETVTLSA